MILETSLIIGVNIILFGALAYWQKLVAQDLANVVMNQASTLDENLRLRISEFLGDYDPGEGQKIHPVIAFAMQAFQNKLDSPVAEVQVIQKDAQGKFTSQQ